MSSSPLSRETFPGDLAPASPRVQAPGGLRELLLGSHPQRQGPARLTLLALLVYAVFAVIVQCEVVVGLMEPQATNLWTAFSLCGISIFYLLVRTGLSERLSADRSLTLPQSVFGVVATSFGYLINPTLRGAVIAIMILNLVWGMFVMKTREAVGLCLFALALLGATMIWASHSDPAQFPPQVEALHFAFATVLLLATSVLSIQMGQLRSRLAQRKVELQQALDRIRDLARVDELTGLYNRRHLGELMAAEHARAARTGRPFALALIDIDHFKAINDGHGHAAGDSVLRTFACVLRSSLRESDFAGRWGGEEFLLVVPDAGPAAAAEVIDRIRAALCRSPFEHVVPGLALTVSAGVATCAAQEDIHAAVERADRALYRAKSGGRNQTQMQ